MDNLYIAPTPSSPEVDFKFDTRILSLRGESYPENAAAFYGDIIAKLREFLATQSEITLEVNIAAAAGNRVVLNWYHDEEDDTILEFGQELSEDFPAIEFVNHSVGAA